MKYFLSLLFSIILFSCKMEKATKVEITNENDFPISVTIKTNNISHTYQNIKANETITEWYNWQGLDNNDGEWIFTVKNENTNGQDQYKHGYFTQGSLYNYVTLISKGDQLKVQISE
ncbi:MAG TPA: hypothetical protein PKA54_04755 [Chitinophagaceae bacterium]|nr:MAG: hypothetical protein UZ11_BCD004001168 [Bacteroidetes bacterium OLB11]HMN32661.1 hypothetical protein [Chitinophagaceae bacterium]